jgi:hypothetical protein
MKVRSRKDSLSLVYRYLSAKRFLESSGYAEEISWQRSRDATTISECDFLREAAWVILCSGFREDVVRKRFPYISLCFCDFESSSQIWENSEQCIAAARLSFGNERKLSAITKVAREVVVTGFEKVLANLIASPIEYLSGFYCIGEITAHHLAKNLGFQLAKPDRHLVRLAKREGFSKAHNMCIEIAERTGDLISVVDIVLWRSMVLNDFQSSPSR